METERVESIAVLVDVENSWTGTARRDRFDFGELTAYLRSRGRVVVRRAYAGWFPVRQWSSAQAAEALSDPFAAAREEALRERFELVHVPRVAESGKNSVDIAMIIDALELAMLHQHIDIIVLVTGDSDFAPLVTKLRTLGKIVIGVAHSDRAARRLVAYYDRFIYWGDIIGAPDYTDVGEADDALDSAFALLSRALRQMLTEAGEILASQVKEMMQRLDPSFSERRLGFSRFRDFLRAAEEAQIVRTSLRGDSFYVVAYRERNALPTQRRTPMPLPAVQSGSLGAAATLPVGGSVSAKAAAANVASEAANVAMLELNSAHRAFLVAAEISNRTSANVSNASSISTVLRRLDPKQSPHPDGYPKAGWVTRLANELEARQLVRLATDANGQPVVELTEEGRARLAGFAPYANYAHELYRQALLANGLGLPAAVVYDFANSVSAAFQGLVESGETPLVGSVIDRVALATGYSNSRIKKWLESLRSLGLVTIGDIAGMAAVQTTVDPDLASARLVAEQTRLLTQILGSEPDPKVLEIALAELLA